MFDYHALAPELILGITLLAAIAVDLVVPERLKYLVGVTALLGLVAAALPLITLAACSGIAGCAATGPRVLFGGSYVVDDFALIDTWYGMVIGHIAILLPFIVWLLVGTYEAVDPDEYARLVPYVDAAGSQPRQRQRHRGRRDAEDIDRDDSALEF